MKICVVDDESEVRVSIIQKLTALFPHEQVFNAEFGYEALKRIELIQPDLVFLDIRMPEFDGLNILQRIHEKYPAIHVVIISGYDDFEYARRALTLGATGFLLKPADRGELSDIVLKVKGMLVQTFIKELDQLMRVTPIPHVSIEQVQPFNVSLWFDEREWKQIELGNRAALLDQYNTSHDILLTLTLDSDLEAIVLRAPLEESASGFRERKAFLPALQSQMRMKRELRFFQMNDAPPSGKRAGQKEWANQAAKHRQIIIQHARTGEISELEMGLNAWFECLTNVTYDELRKECAYLMAVLDEGLGRNNVIMVDEETLYYWHEWIGRHHTWEVLKDRIRHMVINGVRALKKLDQQDREIPQAVNWFKQALQVIENSNEKNLSLEVVSEAVNVHPVTLSRMFKQQMGITFVRYLTRRRMKHASALLLNTRKKVNEISEDIGYADYAYFRSLFKKEFGYSPSEFRKNNGILTEPDEGE
ncbi:response regulator transcription factor [Paenibacillus sp. MMO-58]|uniref:response regulator transcription factor n=1 Tax=Paenibacillus sp. MMO-58 TaxID=3081290 RepID=UPI00301ABF97